MGNELVLVQEKSLPQVLHLGKVLYESGYFSDIKSASQAVVKVLRGQELGLGPVTSLEQIHVVQGKTTLSAGLIGSLVKQSGRYDYQLIRLDDTGCEMVFYANGKEIGRSKFTLEDARKAGLVGRDMWQKYPRNMYFSRALSNGARWYCPDVFRGAVYTREELAEGAVVEEIPAEIIDTAQPTNPNPNTSYSAQEAEEDNIPYTTGDMADGAAHYVMQPHSEQSQPLRQIEPDDKPITAQAWSDFWKACRKLKPSVSNDAVHKAYAPVYLGVGEVKSLTDYIKTQGELDAFFAYVNAGGQKPLI